MNQPTLDADEIIADLERWLARPRLVRWLMQPVPVWPWLVIVAALYAVAGVLWLVGAGL